MAKSARSSNRKANKSRLRARVFGPVEDARTERLSAKLVQLASDPSVAAKSSGLAMEIVQQEAQAHTDTVDAARGGDMEVDEGVATDAGGETLKGKLQTNKIKTTGRIEKRRRGKSSASIVFHQRGKRNGKSKGKNTDLTNVQLEIMPRRGQGGDAVEFVATIARGLANPAELRRRSVGDFRLNWSRSLHNDGGLPSDHQSFSETFGIHDCMMAQKGSTVFLLVANVLLPLAILIFASGFFPYKPFLPGLATYDDVGIAAAPEAPFDRLIFMVVDALRSDFVYSNASGFKFTQRLISNGAALPFTAHATSPTITMPRVKAITTGSIPSFLDVILNFAESDKSSTLANQDTWLAQLKAKENGRLVMYGDDTWLKLFPETFTRADGTSSFFVSDFTEVDNNVTRHIPDELKEDDWNGMIFHFLGLDHIGHKAGPQSPHMVPKQNEMDRIVQQVYDKLVSEDHLQSTLFVLCGDHGMNDAGNHGGSSPGETSPALVFISPKLKQISNGVPCPSEATDEFQFYDTVEQSDVAPTLAGLLGFPVPKNNLGVFIPRFLPFWKVHDRVQLLLGNARQIKNIVNATFTHATNEDDALHDCGLATSSAGELGCLWSKAKMRLKYQENAMDGGSDEVIASLTEFSKRAQEIMSSTASNYNISKLNSGIVMATAAVIAASLASLLQSVKFSFAGISFTVATITYGGMMFASSYVEEEQHFWYWTASGWLVFLYFRESRYRSTLPLPGVMSVACLICLRVARRWNQTGQKYAGAPDIAKAFFPHHNFILWGIVLTTYFDIVQRVSRRGIRRASKEISSIVALTLCLAAFSFKLSFTSADSPELLSGFSQSLLDWSADIPLVTQARTVFLGIVIVIVYALFFDADSKSIEQRNNGDGRVWIYHDLLTLFLATQSRVANIPLFLIFELQFQLLDSLELSLTEVTMTSLLFQHLSFFAFGGSNAISSIDLSNAYNGISGYNVAAVGLLTFVSNWAGPIWWASATSLLLARANASARSNASFRHLTSLSFFVTASLLFVMAACSVLRTHLFIWTVFSPKYLYSMAWTLAHHLCINVVVGNILFWLACGRPSNTKKI